MKRYLTIAVVILFAASLNLAQPRRVKYGSNPAAGKTFVHDGIKLYYETYGTGEPLLLIHGNGGSILDFTKQIDHFRKSYHVIAMDSRDHGRSGDSAGDLTYEKMTDDLAALLDNLKVGPAYVLGWSDGAIEALLLGIRHPAKVKKIAAMAANLNPSDTALRPESVSFIRSAVAPMKQATPSTPEAKRELKVTEMMVGNPNIPLSELKKITVPTLVLSGDHDAIYEHHTVDIYLNLPKGELAIFPNSTHAVPYDDPVLFNGTVEKFFRTPYKPKDRITDMLNSITKMRTQ